MVTMPVSIERLRLSALGSETRIVSHLTVMVLETKDGTPERNRPRYRRTKDVTF